MKNLKPLSLIRNRFWPTGPQPLILMYHRISSDIIDPWGLAVHPEFFEEQIEVLRKTRYPLSLDAFVNRLQDGTLPQNAVAVTFDDGYVDNLTDAKPRLAAVDVPATVFLCTGFLNQSREFWWDELARLILTREGPAQLNLVTRQGVATFDLGAEPIATVDMAWRVIDKPRTPRQKTYIALWEKLREREADECEAFMDSIRLQFSNRRHLETLSRAMTSDEVRELIGGGLISIGAHTVTHPILPNLNRAHRLSEISASKATCENITRATVAGFSYPYGEFNRPVQEDVRLAGFSYAVTTRRSPAGARSALYALPRIAVSNCDGDNFSKKLLQRLM